MTELIQDVLGSQLGLSVVVLLVMFGVVLSACGLSTLAERKVAAFIQDRKGPNRVGPWGILQPLADGLKFFLKEDIIPANVDRVLHLVAPTLSLIIALLGFAIIPWGGQVRFPWMPEGETLYVQVASLDIGVLYLVAVSSLSVYGIVLAGYASNNKYSFYGGMRATAQMLSYEVPIGLSLLVVLLVVGTLRPELIVNQQASSGLWLLFYHPLTFLLLLTAIFAETNRAPFDLAEAEQELVGGYHTEYSAMKFAMFFLGEYAHMLTGSALIVALFCGGWHFWGAPGVEDVTWTAMLIKVGIYMGKVALFLWFFMLIRWTLPRFRFDQLMRIAWKGLIPIGVGLVLGTGVLVALDLHRNLIASLVMNAVVLAVTLWVAGRSKAPITGRQTDLPDVIVIPTQLASRGE